MDKRGIPIVVTSRESNRKLSYIPKPNRAFQPSHSIVDLIKNEKSLLEAYDTFAGSNCTGHYNHLMTNSDLQFSVRDLFRNEHGFVKKEIASSSLDHDSKSLRASKKRPRATEASAESSMEAEEMPDDLETPKSDMNKKRKIEFVEPSSMKPAVTQKKQEQPAPGRPKSLKQVQDIYFESLAKVNQPEPIEQPNQTEPAPPTGRITRSRYKSLKQVEDVYDSSTKVLSKREESTSQQSTLSNESEPTSKRKSSSRQLRSNKRTKYAEQEPEAPHTQQNLTINEPEVPHTQQNLTINEPEAPHTQQNLTINEPEAPHTQQNLTINEPEAPHTQQNPTINEPEAPHTQQNLTINEPEAPHTQQNPTINEPEAPHTQQNPTINEPASKECTTQEPQNDAPRPKTSDVTSKQLEEEKLWREKWKKKNCYEIKKITEAFPKLSNYYQLLERTGVGTFSRVYKARDLLVDHYAPLNVVGDKNYVAIKLLSDISTPTRIANEIQYLSLLRSSPGVTPLITAFRHEAAVFVVQPFIEFDHFEDFYADMTMKDIRCYTSELLTGLKSTHEKGIMHRDVKPGNFLYNNTTKKGYLADYGLAQMSSPEPKKQNPFPPIPGYTHKNGRAGRFIQDSRPAFKADRSGTRGFRAPEVMLRYPHQTTAVDIWAVGVLLLVMLCSRYPFFEPDDDANGITEIAHVFGLKKTKEFAEYYGRRLYTNLPTIPNDEVDMADLCRSLNQDQIDKWDEKEFLLAVDLMKKCLSLIHTERPTAVEALDHPFFK